MTATDAETIDHLMRANFDLERANADLKRQNQELRDAITALLQPAPSELLAKNRAHPSRA